MSDIPDTPAKFPGMYIGETVRIDFPETEWGTLHGEAYLDCTEKNVNNLL
jgi:hypothetical protein